MSNAKPEQTRMTAEELEHVRFRLPDYRNRETIAALLAHIAALESELAARPAADQYTQEQKNEDAKWLLKYGIPVAGCKDIAARLSADTYTPTTEEHMPTRPNMRTLQMQDTIDRLKNRLEVVEKAYAPEQREKDAETIRQVRRIVKDDPAGTYWIHELDAIAARLSAPRIPAPATTNATEEQR